MLNTKVPYGYNVADGGLGGGDQRGEKNHAYGKPSHRRKSVYPNLLSELAKRGFITYRQIGELLGLSEYTLSKKMCGKQNFTDKQKIFLVGYLGKNAEYLFARSDGKGNWYNKGKTPYKNLLAMMQVRGFNTYEEFAKQFAKPMKMSPKNFARKMRGEQNFTNQQKAFLVDYFDKPADYLFARDDDKSSVSNKGKTPYKNLLLELAKRGITTYALIATLMNLSYCTIKRKMSGRRSFTDEEKAFLADYLGKSVEYLFARNDR